MQLRCSSIIKVNLSYPLPPVSIHLVTIQRIYETFAKRPLLSNPGVSLNSLHEVHFFKP